MRKEKNPGNNCLNRAKMKTKDMKQNEKLHFGKNVSEMATTHLF